MTNLYTYETGWLKGKNGTTGDYKFRATIDLNSQSTETNSSNVTAKLEMYCNTNSGSTLWDASSASNQPYGTLSGGLAKTGNRIAKYNKSTTPITVVAYTADIVHDDDGTKSLSETFKWVAGGLTYYPDSFTIATTTVTLPTIARASEISVPNVLITSNTGNLTYTITSAASFYHQLDLAFNGHADTLLTGQLINGTYTGNIAYSDLLTWLGANSSADLELTLYTYSDLAMTTLVGTTTAIATIANGVISPDTDFIRGSVYPRLFPANATTFTTNGLTTLVDVIKCEITEERNGAFELEMELSTTTPYFEEVEVGCLVVAKPNHNQSPQAFEIYEISKPINQRVTIRAQHLSYRASYIPVLPFQATGINDAIIGLNANAEETNPFLIATDITNTASVYKQNTAASLRSRLGGSEGSLLDTFGGEYLWDNWNIYLRKNRGQDNGVQLRLGKNIIGLTQTLDFENVITGALPIWSDGTTTVTGEVQHSASAGDYAYARTIVLDLSGKFETEPTIGQLNQAANTYLQNSSYATPNNNIKVKFIDLADTTEYKDSPLERVNLCDTVEVIYEALNIDYKAKVIKLKYDALADRTIEIEIGKPKQTLAQAINGIVPQSDSGGGGGSSGTVDNALSPTSTNPVENRAIYDELFYKPGDTYTLTSAFFSGLLITSSKRILFTVPLPKRLDNINGATFDAMELTCRAETSASSNTRTYLPSQNVDYTGSGYTISIYAKENNLLTIEIASASSLGGLNNSEILIQVFDMRITFS